MREFLYTIVKRFLTWFGDIYFATTPPLTKAKHIVMAMDLVKKGDIVCRGYNYYLDSYFIPGEFSHSGIVVDNNFTMLHVLAEGVQYIHLIDFIKDTDKFIILNPRELHVRKALDRAIELYENKTEYDFLLNDPDKFYCHEFTTECMKCGGIIVEKTEKTFGIWPFRFKKKLYLAEGIIAKCDMVYLPNMEVKE